MEFGKLIRLIFTLLLAGGALILIWNYAYPLRTELLLSGSIIIAFAVGLFIGLFLQKNTKTKATKILGAFFVITGIVLILAGKDPAKAFNTKEEIKEHLVLSGSIIIALALGFTTTGLFLRLR